MNDIKNYKVKYITEKEANEIYQNVNFCPAHYPHYSIGVVLIDGEIGSCHYTRYILKGGKMFKNIKIIQQSYQDTEVLAWKFDYKDKKYGSVITNEVFGELQESYDEDGEVDGCYRPVVGTKDITNKGIIKLFEGMLKIMKKLEGEK